MSCLLYLFSSIRCEKNTAVPEADSNFIMLKTAVLWDVASFTYDKFAIRQVYSPNCQPSTAKINQSIER